MSPTIDDQIRSLIAQVKKEAQSRKNSIVITKLEEALLWMQAEEVLNG